MFDFVKNDNAQGMVEYALLLALISIVAIAVIKSLGGNVNAVFGKANTELSTAVS